MHRQFITYQGRPLVVGEEDDLLTIPEPGIEVNEILGSEEVTEKIAEDVQVGDLIFKQWATFEEDRPTMPESGVTYTQLINDKGRLLLIASIGNQQRNVYEYLNGKWVDVVGSGRLDTIGYKLMTSAGKQEISAKIINGKIYVSEATGGNQISSKLFGISCLEGDRWRVLESCTASQNPPHRIETNNRYAELQCARMEEHNGTIHFMAGFTDASGLSDNDFKTYTVDLSTEVWTETTADPSGGENYIRGDIKSFNSDLWIVVTNPSPSTVDGARTFYKLFKWNEGTSNWDFDHAISALTSAPSPNYYPTAYVNFKELNGELYIVGHNYSYFNLLKLNTSSNIFEPLALSYADAVGALGADLAIHEGELYATTSHNTMYNTLSALYTHKYDYSTSSFSRIDVTEIDTRLTSSTPGYQTRYFTNSLISYNGEMHTAVGGAGDDHLVLLKWDSSTSSWNRDPRFLRGGTRSHMGSTLTFSGNEYLGLATVNTQLYVSRMTSASDGFIDLEPTKAVDVNISNGIKRCFLYETDGKMYATVLPWSNNVLALYEYDPAQDRFLKLADPSGISGNSLCVEHTHLSGYEYFIAAAYSNGVYVFEASGSNYTRMPDPPSPPTKSHTGADIVVYNGELIAAASNAININPTPTDASAYITSWKWNGSSWDIIPVVLSGDVYAAAGSYINNINYTRVVKMWEEEGNLFLYIARPYANSPETNNMLFRYNSIANQWENQPNPPRLCYDNTPEGALALVMYEGKPWLFGAQSARHTQQNIIVSHKISDNSWKNVFFPNADGTNSFTYEGVVPFVFNNKLYVAYDHFAYDDVRTRIAKLSDYYGQEVWTKYKRPHQHDVRYYETGIALESGSKGDTIKIRKVKR